MKCFQTRESIIRERIDELEARKNAVILYGKGKYCIIEIYCIIRAINRMFKLIDQKK